MTCLLCRGHRSKNRFELATERIGEIDTGASWWRTHIRWSRSNSFQLTTAVQFFHCTWKSEEDEENSPWKPVENKSINPGEAEATRKHWRCPQNASGGTSSPAGVSSRKRKRKKHDIRPFVWKCASRLCLFDGSSQKCSKKKKQQQKKKTSKEIDANCNSSKWKHVYVLIIKLMLTLFINLL